MFPHSLPLPRLGILHSALPRVKARKAALSPESSPAPRTFPGL